MFNVTPWMLPGGWRWGGCWGRGSLELGLELRGSPHSTRCDTKHILNISSICIIRNFDLIRLIRFKNLKIIFICFKIYNKTTKIKNDLGFMIFALCWSSSLRDEKFFSNPTWEMKSSMLILPGRWRALRGSNLGDEELYIDPTWEMKSSMLILPNQAKKVEYLERRHPAIFRRITKLNKLWWLMMLTDNLRCATLSLFLPDNWNKGDVRVDFISIRLIPTQTREDGIGTKSNQWCNTYRNCRELETIKKLVETVNKNVKKYLFLFAHEFIYMYLKGCPFLR